MISTKIKKTLKAAAHRLKPVVIIGQHGLTDAVQKEIERALTDHELIKIKIAATDKTERQTIVNEICEARSAEWIQTIGHIATIYREKEDDES